MAAARTFDGALGAVAVAHSHSPLVCLSAPLCSALQFPGSAPIPPLLHTCFREQSSLPFSLANTQTAATVLNMEEYEKKYSHTKIKIQNNKERNCDIDNK